jgi:hypothetical protein
MSTHFRSALLAAALTLCIAAPAAAQRGAAFGGTAESLEEETFGGCLTTNPSCYHNWFPHEERQNRVLLYTRTAGPRHANINPAATAEGLNPPPLCLQGQPQGSPCRIDPASTGNTAQKGIIRMLNAQGVDVDWTEDVARVTSLNRYRAVIFLSTSRDALWKHGTAVDPAQATNLRTGAHLDAAKTALRQYMRAGGGFVGIHNAFGTEYNWPWYEGLLGNANYYDHGANQPGIVQIEANDPITASIGAKGTRFQFMDEWYNLVPYPTKVKYLATVDESTLATRRETHPGHGNFHPVAWCHYYNGGRVFVTTLGHDARAFADPTAVPPGSPSYFAGAVEFQRMITNGILAAMGNMPFCT